MNCCIREVFRGIIIWFRRPLAYRLKLEVGNLRDERNMKDLCGLAIADDADGVSHTGSGHSFART